MNRCLIMLWVGSFGLLSAMQGGSEWLSGRVQVVNERQRGTHQLNMRLRSGRVTRLDLSNRRFADLDSNARIRLFDALYEFKPPVMALDLSCNVLVMCDELDWYLLQQILKPLEKLDLSYNGFGAYGYTGCQVMTNTIWRALAEVLAASSIAELDLSYNFIGNVSPSVMNLLIDAFAHMQALRFVNVRGNALSDEYSTLLKNALAQHKNHPELLLGEDGVVDAVVTRVVTPPAPASGMSRSARLVNTVIVVGNLVRPLLAQVDLRAWRTFGRRVDKKEQT